MSGSSTPKLRLILGQALKGSAEEIEETAAGSQVDFEDRSACLVRQSCVGYGEIELNRDGALLQPLMDRSQRGSGSLIEAIKSSQRPVLAVVRKHL